MKCSIAQQSVIPAQFAGKVDQRYWQLAEDVAQVSQDGTLSAQALQDALATLQSPSPSFASVNGVAEIRTVISATDTTAETITLLEATGVQLDAVQLANGGSALANNQFYAWIPAQLVNKVAGLAVVKNLALPVNGIADAGEVTTEGDAILRADEVRSVFANLGFDGTGIKVGVISTGVPNRASVQATGDLPATITIDPVRSGQLTNDEGTAMLEIVHDLAPGAELFFSGFISRGFDGMGQEIVQFTAADMVDSINWLVGQGVDIIVDDLQFFNEPAFTDGIVAQAAANAVTQGVTFVSAAGNRADRHYQGQFVDSGGGFQDFKLGAGVDNILNVNVAPNSTVNAWLHWSDPLGTSANNYDVSFFDFTAGAFIGTPGANIQDGIGGDDDPLEVASWKNTTGSTVQVGLVVQRTSGIDRELEIYITSAGVMADDDATITDSLFGHKAIESVITAGAIDAVDPGNDAIEAFSSRGPSTIYTNFATQTSTTRNSLDGAAIDGVQTQVGQLGMFSNPFFGTSAAAPHAAGIAALLLSIDPTLTPAAISTILADTAVDILAPGYDGDSGAGRFDAYAAATSILPPKITAVAIVGPNALDGVNGSYSIPTGDGNQIRTVPIGGADIINITFDEAINVATLPNALSLTGAFTGSDYTTQVVYQGFDSLSNTATWEYTPGIATDQFPADQMVLTLADTVTDASGNLLDGEWNNPTFLTATGTSTFPSGDGAAGGAFVFYFTILPGDVASLNGLTPDNIINASYDGSVLLANLGTTSGASYFTADFNGDGAVTASGDGNLLLNNFGKDFTQWPAGQQAASSGGGGGPRTLAATDAAFSNFSSLLDSLAGGLGSALAVV